MSDTRTTQDLTGLEIAIIGMDVRVPGAATLSEFWVNLCNGTESLTRFSDDELKARGVPAEMRQAADFVPVGAPLDGQDVFDAAFFGFSPNEAEILDPQQRLFLECAWNALENAGCAPNKHDGAIGVYAAAGMNGYLHNLYGNARIRNTVTPYEIFTSNDKDFLATRTSYKLNLRGPAVTVQTACSSSLVAVHLAVQSLLAGECDMALAGGVSLIASDGPTQSLHEAGMLSPRGECSAFTQAADGVVRGEGCGLVLLKPLSQAVAQGDRVWSVLRGTAVNQDGRSNGLTAPNGPSQQAVIRRALAVSGLEPNAIDYLEAHGTGTELGDPTEMGSLVNVFAADRKTNQPDASQIDALRVGSAKTSLCN